MADLEAKLLGLFRQLPVADRDTLLAFAEFLSIRQGGEDPAPAPVLRPEPLPRPEKESVIGAIKRLSATYYMLDRSKMLHETSALMAQHMMQGRPAPEVIDELESVFLRHYEKQSGGRDE